MLIAVLDSFGQLRDFEFLRELLQCEEELLTTIFGYLMRKPFYQRVVNGGRIEARQFNICTSETHHRKISFFEKHGCLG